MDEVLALEKIAKESHNGNVERYQPEGRLRDKDGLGTQEKMMGISVKQRIAQIRQNYPIGTVIAADLGCFDSAIVGDLNLLENVAAFGIDRTPRLNISQGLSPYRLIVADLEDMPQIPDNSFHYLMSFNALSYTNPKKSLPEIYRVLKPGGVADLDIEFWERKFKEQITSLQMSEDKHLIVRFGNLVLSTEDYLAYKKKIEKDPKMKLMALPFESTSYFIMIKLPITE